MLIKNLTLILTLLTSFQLYSSQSQQNSILLHPNVKAAVASALLGSTIVTSWLVFDASRDQCGNDNPVITTIVIPATLCSLHVVTAMIPLIHYISHNPTTYTHCPACMHSIPSANNHDNHLV